MPFEQTSFARFSFHGAAKAKVKKTMEIVSLSNMLLKCSKIEMSVMSRKQNIPARGFASTYLNSLTEC